MPVTTTTIAVCTQNRRTVTGHAGRCRRFQLFTFVEQDSGEYSTQMQWAELPEEDTLHHARTRLPMALTGIDAIVTKGLGEGLKRKLDRLGVAWAQTSENDPMKAASKIMEI
jgi:predicted Fe-Mo cluster-binding NifX family protein